MNTSTRGLKYQFNVNEKVLCYEPDPTKAKVLYESKILQQVAGRNSRGKKSSEYLVHFYGWNSSWDRCVGEESILPFTEENCQLQMKLAEQAALTLQGKKKKKLPPLIKDTLKRQCSENGSRDSVDSPPSNYDSDSSEEEDREFIIDIPANLRRQLAKDYKCITQDNMLVKLPCSPNVIDILEDYVEHRIQTLLCATPPRSANGKYFMPSNLKNKINFLREATNGFKVLFDFHLCRLLLYQQEKSQFYSEAVKCIPIRRCLAEKRYTLLPSIQDSAITSTSTNFDTSIRNVTPVKTESELLSTTTTVDLKNCIEDKETQIKKLRGRSKVQLMSLPKVTETVDEIYIKPNVTIMAETALENRKKRGRPKGKTKLKSKSKHTVPKSSPKQESQADNKMQSSLSKTEACTSDPEMSDAPSMRITRQAAAHQALASPTSLSPQTAGDHLVPLLGGSSPPVTPGPPMSLTSKCVSSSNSSVNLASHGQRYQEALKEIIAWKLTSEEKYNAVPADPSLVYGTQHLLRLFYKLPDIMSKSSLPAKRLKLLSKVITEFLEYLSEKKDELFIPSSYIEFKE